MERATAADAIDTPEFLDRLAQSDRAAIATLCCEYAGTMMEQLKKSRNRHGLAQDEWPDIVQEVFLKFLTKPPKIDPSRKIGPLLRTMVLNEARDRSKMNRTRSNNEIAGQTERLRGASGGEEAGARLIATENKQLLRKKLAQLSTSDKQALDMFAQDGPHRHVAALAAARGITQGAAQMQFVRAKARWARVLGEGQERDKG